MNIKLKISKIKNKKYTFHKVIALFFVAISLLSISGCSEGNKEIHHVFPQQFRGEFEKMGIDIDKYGIALTKETHRGVGGGLHSMGWNKKWAEFFTFNKSPTESQAMKHLEVMLSESGFQGEQQFVNYGGAANGMKTGVVVLVKSQNRLLQVLGSLGEKFINLFGDTTFGSSLISFLATVGVTFLGFFGIKIEHPVAVGVGLVVSIIGFLLAIGILYIAFLINPWLLISIIVFILIAIAFFLLN